MGFVYVVYIIMKDGSVEISTITLHQHEANRIAALMSSGKDTVRMEMWRLDMSVAVKESEWISTWELKSVKEFKNE